MADQPTYQDDQKYTVHLLRLVVLGGHKLLPRQEHSMKGKVLNRIVEQEGADVIAAAEPI